MPNYPLGNIGDKHIEQVYELTKASIVFQNIVVSYSDIYISQGTLKGEVSLYR